MSDASDASCSHGAGILEASSVRGIAGEEVQIPGRGYSRGDTQRVRVHVWVAREAEHHTHTPNTIAAVLHVAQSHASEAMHARCADTNKGLITRAVSTGQRWTWNPLLKGSQVLCTGHTFVGADFLSDQQA